MAHEDKLAQNPAQSTKGSWTPAARSFEPFGLELSSATVEAIREWMGGEAVATTVDTTTIVSKEREEQ